LLVGVVLAAGQHAPEQNRQLAGGRDDRLAVTAARAGAVIEGVQRARLQDRAPGGLTSAQRAPALPRLVMRPLRAGASPDWRTFGSRPK
jgi:hypothetical protein